MTTQLFFLWMIFLGGGIAAGWCLAVRPTGSMRSIAPTVSVLAIGMAVVLSLLGVVAGQEPSTGSFSFASTAFGR